MSLENTYSPMRGINIWKNKRGALVFRLHHTADPEKTMEWFEGQAKGMEPAYAAQEFQIDFHATSGQLIYHLNREVTLEDEFTVPPEWTRYFVLDPGRAKPHACLWLAVDPENFMHVYRELWPSKVYNMPGNVPEDDNLFTPREFTEAVAWLESKENVKQNARDEKFEDRIIDYFARTLREGSVTTGTDPGKSLQDLFEEAGDDISRNVKYEHFDFRFSDATKENKDVSISMVNAALKPSMRALKKDGTGFEMWSKLRIMKQRCPELIWQLENNRIAQRSAHQKEVSDPELKGIQKRNDLTDGLCYLIRNEPEYREVNPSSRVSTWLPAYEGVSY